MHLTKRLRQNLLIALTVCIISVCVVFATASAQILPDAAEPSIAAPQDAQEGGTAASQTQPAVKGVSQTHAAVAPKPRIIVATMEYIEAAQEETEALSEAEETALEAEADGKQDAALAQNGSPDEQQSAQTPAEQAPLEDAPPTDIAQTDISVFLPLPEEQPPASAAYLDSFIATAYCVTGTTSTGTQTTVGRTLAVNPGIIPYGSHVWLYLEDGTLVGDFIAEDTGSNMLAHPYVIDIYMGEDSYNTCILWGARRVLVYIEAAAQAEE